MRISGLLRVGAVPALLLLALPALAGVAESPPVCDEARPDISDQCLTTPLASCVDAVGASVTVQIGGPGAEDSDANSGTCAGTRAVALVTFTKLAGNQLTVEVDNRTCDDNGSLTALFHNYTPTVTGFALDGQPTALSGTRDVNWEGDYSQTTSMDDGFGYKADGFGSFDAAIHNGNNLNPNGGNKLDIKAGEVFEFTINVETAFNLCDFLSEISTPPPGNRNRNIVGRWQACGDPDENSAYIGPCSREDELLAVIDNIELIPGDRSMRVEWSTSLEIQNAGFNIVRREATRGGWERVNVNLLPGQGDTVSGAEYAFVDDTALNGVEYVYRIEDIDFGGRIDLSERHTDVVNPRSPQVSLTYPAYGATVDLSDRPRFAFESHRSHGHMIMQISADPTFSTGSIVSTHVSARFGFSEITLSRRTSRLAASMAQENEGIVYWRLVDGARNPVSDTLRIEIEDSEGNGVSRFSRGGVNR